MADVSMSANAIAQQQKIIMEYFHEYAFYRMCGREAMMRSQSNKVLSMNEALALKHKIAEYARSHNMDIPDVTGLSSQTLQDDAILRGMRTDDMLEAMGSVFTPLRNGSPFFQKQNGSFVKGRSNPSYLNNEQTCRLINAFYAVTNINIGQQKSSPFSMDQLNSGQVAAPSVGIRDLDQLGHMFIPYKRATCFLPVTVYDSRFYGRLGATVSNPMYKVEINSRFRDAKNKNNIIDLTHNLREVGRQHDNKAMTARSMAQNSTKSVTQVPAKPVQYTIDSTAKDADSSTEKSVEQHSMNTAAKTQAVPSDSKPDVTVNKSGYDKIQMKKSNAKPAINVPSTSTAVKSDSIAAIPSGNGEKDKDPLAALRPYMTDKEYDKIRSRFVEDETGRPIKEIPHLSYAVGFLNYLRDNGCMFTLDTDKFNGQIKCCFGNRTNMRIVDVSNVEKGSERYIGRAQVGGSSFYYNVRGRNRDFIPDTNMMVALYQYINGETTKSLDGNGYIGVNRTIYNRNNPAIKRNTSYWMPPVTEDGAKRRASSFTANAGFYKLEGDENRRFSIYKIEDNVQSDITDEIEANAYLKEAVLSARKNFYDALDFPSIISEAEVHKDDVYHDYDLNPNSQVSIIQREYINLIKGNITSLPLSDGRSIKLEDYDNNYEAAISAHALAVTDDMIGFYSDSVGSDSFNPANVATFMNSDFGVYQNADEIVNALRILDYPPSALRTSDSNFYNKTFVDKLVKFNPDTAYPMNEGSPFVKSMYEKIKETFEQTGCEPVNPKNVRIDDNGIVHYIVQQNVGQTNRSLRTIEGEIGQIFEPDAMGLVTTKFAGRGDNNYMFAPGYEAYVVPQKDGENLPMEARTRLRGYEHVMRDAIGRQIRRDILGPEGPLGFGSTTTLNNVYSHLYDERYPVDYLSYMQATPEQKEFTETRVYMATRKVRYPTAYRDESTLNAEWRKEHGMTNDKGEARDLYALTGTNMAVIDKTSNGYFDPTATSTGSNQGIVRYLADGAKIGIDGTITPCDPDSPEARCRMMRHSFFENAVKHDPADRNAMAFNNAMVALNAGRVGIAYMSAAGYGFDDGFIVSKKFANVYRLPSAEGDGRSLVIGDKISDFHGNKGVISKVIDPDMTEAEANEAHIPYELVQMFKANPDLEVIGAPYAAVSRFNGGTARDAMANARDLVMPDGSVREGCLAHVAMQILPQVADEKTHVYGREEQMIDKGRRISGQFAWAMQSKGATALAHEVYGPNSRALTELREYLLVEGMDMDATGHIVMGYHPHGDEKRLIHDLPDVSNMWRDVTVNATATEPEHVIHKFTTHTDTFDLRDQFMQDMGRTGGFIRLPFSLKFNAGNSLPESSDGDGYLLPLMSSDLRSGQDFSEDTSGSTHAYTRGYMYIYENACRYQYLDYLKDNKEFDKDYPDVKSIEKAQEKLVRDSQDRFDAIANDVKVSRFDTKDNIFKDVCMARRMPDSATAVWTADPNLDIDQIAMNTEMAKTLGCVPEHGGHKRVLVWRDPILHDSNVRYMRVVIDDNLTGVAINPAMDKCFDGDFDGDTVGLYAPKTRQAQEECFDKFSPAANLLNYGVVDENGKHPLNYHVDGLDLSASMANMPELAQHQQRVYLAANALDEDFANGRIDEHARANAGQRLLELHQSDITREAFRKSMGLHVLSFKDMESHFKSLEQFVKDGAKGSMKKLSEYAEYIGADLEMEDDEIISVTDLGEPKVTRDDLIETQKATAVKTFGTGIAGSYSHRVFTVLRNKEPLAALEVTYPNTQAILQAKHDARDAMHKYDVLMSSARDLWKGRKLEAMDTEDGVVWTPVKIPGRKDYVRATPKDFITAFHGIYDDLGVSYNPEHVERIANVLTDPKSGYIMNLEVEARDEFADLIDKGAYVHSFDDLVSTARTGKNNDLFAHDSLFTPDVIRKNRECEANGEPVVAIMRMDTATVDMKRQKAQERYDRKMAKIAQTVTHNDKTPNVVDSVSVDGIGDGSVYVPNTDKVEANIDAAMQDLDRAKSGSVTAEIDETSSVEKSQTQDVSVVGIDPTKSVGEKVQPPPRAQSKRKSDAWFAKGREKLGVKTDVSPEKIPHDGSTMTVNTDDIRKNVQGGDIEKD